jgi:hypothetical protein
MGEGDDAGREASDDPFAELRAAGFFDGAPHEPSAEERMRLAERRSRQADLQRRLAEEAEHERRLAERDRKVQRRTGTTAWSVGSSKYRNLIAPAVLLLLLGAVSVAYLQRGGDSVASVFEPPTPRPSDYPPVDEEVADAPLGTPPPAPASPAAFEFIATQDEGDAPVTWDPCRPIRYVVNPAGAPPGADALVDEAIARASAATGLVFVNEGTTDEPWKKDRDPYQPDRYGEKWAPALIAWSNETEVPGLAGYIAGLGGPTARSVPGDAAGTMAYVSGQVVLDASDLGVAIGQPGGADGVRSVIQHEVGHMVGLDHVADPTQLMFSESTVLDWGSGDLAGLHELGSGPCFPEL